MAIRQSIVSSRQSQSFSKHHGLAVAMVLVLAAIVPAHTAFAQAPSNVLCKEEVCLMTAGTMSPERLVNAMPGTEGRNFSLTLEKSFGELVRWPNSRYCSLAMSPDGALLAAGECHPFGLVHVWELGGSDTAPLFEFEAQPCEPGCRVGSPSSLAFSHDGTKLAAALFNNNVQVWDLKTGDELVTLGGHTQHEEVHATDVTFSPNDKIIATGSEPPAQVILWDASSGKELRRHSMSRLGSSQPFSADGSMVVLLNGDRSNVTFWSVETGEEEVGGCLGAMIDSAAFSGNGELIAITGNTHVEFWKLQTKTKVTSSAHDNETDGDVCPARNVHGFKLLPPLNNPNIRPQPILFSPDDRWFVAFRDDRIVVWDARTLRELLNDRIGYVASAAFGPDGTSLVTVGGRGDEFGIRLWRLDD